MGAIVPAELSGAGLSYPEYVIVVEELSRVDGSIGLFVAAHNSLCVNHILLFGTDDQKRRHVPDLASGKKIGAWAITESGSGSDAGRMRTRAGRQVVYHRGRDERNPADDYRPRDSSTE
jgi:alkylation response protein AidB-like acyl-CoA dehydrogenase